MLSRVIESKMKPETFEGRSDGKVVHDRGIHSDSSTDNLNARIHDLEGKRQIGCWRHQVIETYSQKAIRVQFAQHEQWDRVPTGGVGRYEEGHGRDRCCSANEAGFDSELHEASDDCARLLL